MTQPTLAGLLRWASAEYAAETPALQHAGMKRPITDDGGAPVMDRKSQGYVGLLASDKCVRGHRFCTEHAPRDEEPDNWRWTACQVAEGRYRTPIRCAIESFGPDGRDADGKPIYDRRLFIRDVLANALFPSDIAEAHGIPRWAAGDVLYRCLVQLRERYKEGPVPERGWISGRSDAQRDAETAA